MTNVKIARALLSVSDKSGLAELGHALAHHGVELVGHSGDQNGFISHLYIHRPSRSGYIVAFNTNVTSARDPRHTTRAVDEDVRDAIVREFWMAAR